MRSKLESAEARVVSAAVAWNRAWTGRSLVETYDAAMTVVRAVRALEAARKAAAKARRGERHG